jgi:hypothetical protein
MSGSQAHSATLIGSDNIVGAWSVIGDIRAEIFKQRVRNAGIKIDSDILKTGIE